MNNKAAKTKVNVIEKDAFDQLAWSGVSEARNVAKLYEDQSQEGVVQDIFNSLYKAEPKVVDQAPVAQKGVLEQMMQLPEFDQLRSGTQVDDIASAIGTMELAPQVLEQYKKVIEKLKQKYANSRPQEGLSLSDLLGEDDMAQLRQSLRRALDEAQEATDEVDGMARAWGLNSEEFKSLPFEDRLAIAERLRSQRNLKNITDLVGRFKNVVNAASATVPSHGYDEIVDTGLGDDIPRLVPSEFFKFSKQKTLFYKDLLEKKLLNYNLKGVENLGKGPIIICQDKSGSMQGGRDEWATAVAIAMSDLATKQNRAFGVIHFEATVGKSYYWPRNHKPSVMEKINMASVGTAGGTDFYKALKAAYELRNKEPELKPCDIVLITDGEYIFTDDQLAEILEIKKQTQVRIYGIAISDGASYSSGLTLKSFCDQINVVNSLGEIEVLKDLVNKAAMPQMK